MMEYAVAVFLFAAGLALLVKGGDLFVDNALWFARRFRIPEMVIGATVVSIGTTLPELLVSATAAAQGNNGIAYGNAVGSIICNTGLIAALVFVFVPPAVNRVSFFQGTAFFFVAAAVYVVSAVTLGGIPRHIALLLIGTFLFNMYRTLKSGGESGGYERAEGGGAVHILVLLLGAAALYFGSQLMVDNAVKFAHWLNVPEKVIGLTIIALGTSLPELTTALIAIRKGHGALSVGNILGANFINIVLVSGVASLISPIVVDAFAIRTDIIMMLFMMLVFTLPTLIRGRGSKTQGLVLIVSYILYVQALYG